MTPAALDRYPLSPMQQGMLFQSLSAPDSGVAVQQIVISLPENLDPPAFESAWQSLAARHDTLRARFLWADGDEPLQEVQESVAVPVEFRDLRDLEPGARQERFDQFLREDRRLGFDLGVAPLMRVTALRFAEAEYRVVWTIHHILHDGQIMPGLIREAFTLYEATLLGEEPELETRRPYREFIAWLGERDVGASKPFWQDLLDGYSAPAPLSIGGETAGSLDGKPNYGMEKTVLPRGLADSLRSYAEQNGATLNTLVQGAWAILLSRYGREQDVVFGATRACRRGSVPGAGHMIGPMINTLPVRARVSPETELLPFLGLLRAQSIAVRPHEHTPLYKVKEWSDVPAGGPLFESIIVFSARSFNAVLRAQGGEWASRNVEPIDQTNYPLTLGVLADPEPEVLIRYERPRFDRDAIRRMLGHFTTLLEGIASGQFTRVAELPLLTAAEREQIVVEWNRVRNPFPAVCLQELFEEQAERQPGETAVVFEGESLTYGELDRRANRIAGQLRSLGVGPEVTVAICTGRSLEMVAGILGILKAGGAYVPLDPEFPRERLRFMMEDAGTTVLLAQEESSERFGGEAAEVIPLESAGDGFPETAPPAAARPENLAYIMYTSGSTGKPKGVEIEHRQVVAFLHSFHPLPPAEGRRTGTNVAPFSFDTSVEEIFAPLISGGTVHVIRPEHSTDARYFARYLVDEGVNYCYIVPDMLEPVARELAPLRDRLQLRCLETGLAPKKQRSLQVWRDLSPNLRILNAYGPTEVTYGATVFEFVTATDLDGETPIGRPFANYPIYIVDEGLQPVPVGVAGELLIGGTGVARGYRNQPELTAEKFIPDPFGEPGGRLYRTGDLTRYLPDGNIEFLGRIDNQLKIRGYRIEPGEIESAMNEHDCVERSLVVPWQGPPGDTRLVAYVIPKNGEAPAEELRGFLQARLPAYMIPAAIVSLDAFPLMTNGKIDRAALPEPGRESFTGDEPLLTARDALEARLKRIWEKVLGVSPVGIRDDFFELGGHSLLAVSLFSEMEKAGGVHLPLAALFDAPTIEKLARRIRDGQDVPAWSSLVPIQPRGSHPPFYAVHAQSGNILFYRELALSVGPEQPVYGLQAVGLDGRQPPFRRIEEMATHYVEEILSLQPEGPYYLGGYCLGAYIALEMARQLEARGEAVGQLVCFDTDGAWRRSQSVRQGIAYHLRYLSGADLREKLSYAAERLGFRWLRVRHAVGERIAAVYAAFRRPLPRVLRDLHVYEAHYAANRSYNPARNGYSGRLLYFQATGGARRDPREFWGDLVAGGVDIEAVPGKDEQIFRGSNAAVLGERLRARLTREQGDARHLAYTEP